MWGMTTHPVYDLLLAEVTEAFEKDVLSVLIGRAGEKTSRPDLVFCVFGIYVQSGELANCTEDRKIREAIERLQLKGFPIVASSGSAGYVLLADEAELDKYLAEIITRQIALRAKQNALRQSRKWIKFVREYRDVKDRPAQQMPMFRKPTVMP